ncbi:MAG: T9SS type A sorting domain-containing protein [Ferruginibacter sp.]
MENQDRIISSFAKRIGFILCLTLALNVSFGQLLTNPITDPNPGSYNPFILGQTVNANITVSGIGRGSGITSTSGTDRYNAQGWNSASFDANKYFTFTLAPNAGYLIKFVSFVYTGQASGSGATNFAFRSSIDGFTANIGTPSSTGATISLAGAAYQNINTTIEFRLYGWGASAAGGTFSVNDFTFNGTCIAGPSLTGGTLIGFGNVCTNTVPGVNIFTISGAALTGANFTVGALTGFTYSTDNITFTSTLNFAQAAGTMAPKNIYVQFSPLLVQSYNGNIPVGGGGAPSINVAATGSGVNTTPTINNGTVSGVTTSSANVAANISSTGCTAISAYGVEYSTTPGFVNGTGTPVAGGALVGGNFTSNLVGLAPPGQIFYIHTFATNAGGTTYGTENAFTLLNTVPSLTVPPSGAGALNPYGSICINTTSVDFFNLSGSVLNGSNVVIGPLTGFRFSTAAGGPFTATLTLTNGGAPYTYSGGTLAATVYVRFAPTLVQSYNGNVPVSGGGATAISVAASGAGINDISTLTTGNAIFITTTGAILPGTIVTSGCGVLLGYGIEYSTTNGFLPGTGTQVPASNLSSGSFSVTFSTLTPNTTYYYYAYAITAGGTGYGTPQNSFLTATAPTQLVITSISPASPIALTPFTITITAVDDLVNLNPTNVTSNTDITMAQVAGVNILTFPSSPIGTIPAGSNSITISGTFYDVPETSVGMTATASSGMVVLGTSATFNFDVIAYTGPSTFIWSASGGQAWLTGTNWQTGTSPGSSIVGVNQHVASYTSLAGLPAAGCGINMNSVGGDYSLGTIYFADTYSSTVAGDIEPIGNSSTGLSGVLSLYGSSLNNVGGIGGNNYSGLLLANYMTSATTKTMEIRNTIGSGNQNFTLNLVPTVTPGYIVAGALRTINLNVLLTGTQPLTFTGGGTFGLTPSGAASVNTFSGAITVANGTLITGNTGAFSTVAPNVITLGSTASNFGTLKLNGNSVTIGGLSSPVGGGNSNIADNGSAAATLTINNSASYIFNGALKDGATGALTLIKNGIGSETLKGLNTFTGLTTIYNGSLILSHTGGGTFPVANSVTVNGTGTIRISTDQTLKNITLATGGTLLVDAGVTLTITGTYSAASCNVINNGTIKMQGAALQTFPGTAAIVSSMNNLTINNAFGVNLNNSLNIAGTLNLNSGTFTVGAYTLTLNNPITGTLTNFSANNTSSIIIAGTAAGINIPVVVTQLKALTISNTIGSTLQGPLNISTTLFISAGTLDDNQFVLNGLANTTMTGGILNLQQNTATLPGLTGVYVLTGGTVIFDGVGIGTDAQTIRPINYFNLASAANGDRILNPAGTIGVANVFIPNLPNNLYTVVNSTINYNKTAAQSIAAFGYYNLTLSGGTVTKTLAGNIDVQAALTLATNATFALANFNTTLKSDASNTANVAVINTANSITYGTGKFIVERYLPTGIAHGKTWQLLAVPVSGSQSVNAAWQEGNASLAPGTSGLGTTISSEKPAATGRGYDFYTPAGASIKTYNSTTNAWVGIDDGATNTSALPIANKKGYMLFVRGDRTVQTSATAANVTTLRTSGKLFSPGTDAPSASPVTAGKFETVGNPYASIVDFTNLQTTSTGIDAKYYVWDPLLAGAYGYGGYQLLSSANTWKPSPGGTLNYPTGIAYTKIQSGQAFFVYSTGGGNVSFAESNKLAGTGMVYRVTDNTQNGFVRAWLYDANDNMYDGNVVAFNPGYSNSFDADDALKLDNATENFGIIRNGRTLALEAMKNVIASDTIFYHFTNLKTHAYQLRFVPENMDGSGLLAYLVDKFTGLTTVVNLSGNTEVNFSVTSDAASAASDRFYLVFNQPVIVPVTYIEISATRNSDAGITVNWNVENETGIDHYEVERGADGQNLASIETAGASSNNGGNARYNYIDSRPLKGDNFYRIRSVGMNGNIKYSAIVKVRDVKEVPAISIYPNPVVDKIMNITFTGQPAGNYNIQLSNKLGQVVYKTNVEIANSSTTTTRSVNLGNEISSGIYQVVISSQNRKFTEQVIVK